MRFQKSVSFFLRLPDKLIGINAQPMNTVNLTSERRSIELFDKLGLRPSIYAISGSWVHPPASDGRSV
jgi:hypothetical protein